MPSLPALFVERLKNIVPDVYWQQILDSFSKPAAAGIRVNLLKTDLIEAQRLLEAYSIELKMHPAEPNIFIVSSSARMTLREAEEFRTGLLYWQSPSSALPAVVLNPAAGDRILDLCAAPGSKTTQIAAMTGNDGEITAVEVVKARFYKLKAVTSMMGARLTCVLADGRRFRPQEGLFDRVLVDVPCSSEGRFDTSDKDSFGYWSPHKIKEMAHKQKGLLLNASRCVKPGGVLVYSTCTFAPEENESVVDWFLRKSDGKFSLESFDLSGVPRYPALTEFQGRSYKQDLSACWRVLPDGVFSAFFIAKFMKVPQHV